MSDRRLHLDAAEFLDASPIPADSLRRTDQQRILEIFLSCCYQQIGRAPHLLDGDDLRAILTLHLPARFGRKDPLIGRVIDVVTAFLGHLRETRTVSQDYELHRALADAAGTFERSARSRDIERVGGPAQAPVVHRAPKTGRNEPCPCGSGRKFKQCCARLGS